MTLTTPEGTTWLRCVAMNSAALRKGDGDKSKKLLNLIFLLEEMFPDETMAERKHYER